jgi:hypothetical protein
MKNIDVLLPEFSKMVYRCSLEGKNKPRVLFSHLAFNDEEHDLMGSAIKFCALQHIGIIVVGKPDGKEDVDIDIREYGIEDVEALGKKVKTLAKKHKSVKIPSLYMRLCENCGIDLEDEDQTYKAGNQNYYHKDGKKEKVTTLTIEQVKEAKKKYK